MSSTNHDLNRLHLLKLARQTLEDEESFQRMSSEDLVALCRQFALLVSDQGRLIEETAAVPSIDSAGKMEALGMFAGGIAHDFNNILGIIANRATLALVAQYSNPEQCEHMKQVLRATGRGKELIKQILTFSRPGSATLTAIELGPIVEDTFNFLRATLPASISVQLEIPPVPVLASGDSTQISQILMNLAANAVAAMPEGGALTLRLETDPASEQVLLVVDDTGEGMDEELLPRIFEPYFTTHRGGRGTGLGLSVVHGIVKRHSGTILCESWPGRGTRFSIRLPLFQGQAEATLASQPGEFPLQCALARGQNSACRILFVDDEEELARSSRKLLESFGHQPAVFTSPAKALAAFASSPQGFDLVITDMLMPEMNGQDLAREILALNPDMPVIICTGYSDRFSREQALAQGLKGYVPKPIDWLELDTLINELATGKKPPHA
jgi:two-component system cell cycle sensor histidine kinase/response regulator CckA